MSARAAPRSHAGRGKPKRHTAAAVAGVGSAGFKRGTHVYGRYVDRVGGVLWARAVVTGERAIARPALGTGLGATTHYTLAWADGDASQTLQEVRMRV